MLKLVRKGDHVELLINDSLDDLIKLELEIKVFDKDGKVIKRKRFKCKSFLLNLIKYLHAVLAVVQDSVVDTGGTARTVTSSLGIYYNTLSATRSVNWQFLRINGAEGAANLGIVVGSGSTPTSPTDYSLEAPISHGTGTGQLYHYAVGFVAPYTDESGIHFEVYRQFSNQTTDTITVREIGIIAYHRFYIYDGIFGTQINQTARFLIIRDVISPVDIPATGGMEVRYIFTFTAECTTWLAEALYSMFSATSRTFTGTDGASVSACIAVNLTASGSGTERYSYVTVSNAAGGKDDDTRGIVVGGSDVAFDPTQYRLQSLIPQGTGTDQLDYQAPTKLDVEELDDRYRIGFKRYFVNLSGGNITIKEIGIYAYHRAYFKYGATTVINKTLYYMLLRKVLPTPATIPHLASFAVTWYLSIPK